MLADSLSGATLVALRLQSKVRNADFFTLRNITVSDSALVGSALTVSNAFFRVADHQSVFDGSASIALRYEDIVVRNVTLRDVGGIATAEMLEAKGAADFVPPNSTVTITRCTMSVGVPEANSNSHVALLRLDSPTPAAFDITITDSALTIDGPLSHLGASTLEVHLFYRPDATNFFFRRAVLRDCWLNAPDSSGGVSSESAMKVALFMCSKKLNPAEYLLIEGGGVNISSLSLTHTNSGRECKAPVAWFDDTVGGSSDAVVNITGATMQIGKARAPNGATVALDLVYFKRAIQDVAAVVVSDCKTIVGDAHAFEDTAAGTVRVTTVYVYDIVTNVGHGSVASSIPDDRGIVVRSSTMRVANVTARKILGVFGLYFDYDISNISQVSWTGGSFDVGHAASTHGVSVSTVEFAIIKLFGAPKDIGSLKILDVDVPRLRFDSRGATRPYVTPGLAVKSTNTYLCDMWESTPCTVKIRNITASSVSIDSATTASDFQFALVGKIQNVASIKLQDLSVGALVTRVLQSNTTNSYVSAVQFFGQLINVTNLLLVDRVRFSNVAVTAGTPNLWLVYGASNAGAAWDGVGNMTVSEVSLNNATLTGMDAELRVATVHFKEAVHGVRGAIFVRGCSITGVRGSMSQSIAANTGAAVRIVDLTANILPAVGYHFSFSVTDSLIADFELDADSSGVDAVKTLGSTKTAADTFFFSNVSVRRGTVTSNKMPTFCSVFAFASRLGDPSSSSSSSGSGSGSSFSASDIVLEGVTATALRDQRPVRVVAIIFSGTVSSVVNLESIALARCSVRDVVAVSLSGHSRVEMLFINGVVDTTGLQRLLLSDSNMDNVTATVLEPSSGSSFVRVSGVMATDLRHMILFAVRNLSLSNVFVNNSGGDKIAVAAVNVSTLVTNVTETVLESIVVSAVRFVVPTAAENSVAVTFLEVGAIRLPLLNNSGSVTVNGTNSFELLGGGGQQQPISVNITTATEKWDICTVCFTGHPPSSVSSLTSGNGISISGAQLILRANITLRSTAAAVPAAAAVVSFLGSVVDAPRLSFEQLSLRMDDGATLTGYGIHASLVFFWDAIVDVPEFALRRSSAKIAGSLDADNYARVAAVALMNATVAAGDVWRRSMRSFAVEDVDVEISGKLVTRASHFFVGIVYLWGDVELASDAALLLSGLSLTVRHAVAGHAGRVAIASFEGALAGSGGGSSTASLQIVNTSTAVGEFYSNYGGADPASFHLLTLLLAGGIESSALQLLLLQKNTIQLSQIARGNFFLQASQIWGLTGGVFAVTKIKILSSTLTIAGNVTALGTSTHTARFFINPREFDEILIDNAVVAVSNGARVDIAATASNSFDIGILLFGGELINGSSWSSVSPPTITVSNSAINTTGADILRFTGAGAAHKMSVTVLLLPALSDLGVVSMSDNELLLGRVRCDAPYTVISAMYVGGAVFNASQLLVQRFRILLAGSIDADSTVTTTGGVVNVFGGLYTASGAVVDTSLYVHDIVIGGSISNNNPPTASATITAQVITVQLATTITLASSTGAGMALVVRNFNISNLPALVTVGNAGGDINVNALRIQGTVDDVVRRVSTVAVRDGFIEKLNLTSVSGGAVRVVPLFSSIRFENSGSTAMQMARVAVTSCVLQQTSAAGPGNVGLVGWRHAVRNISSAPWLQVMDFNVEHCLLSSVGDLSRVELAVLELRRSGSDEGWVVDVDHISVTSSVFRNNSLFSQKSIAIVYLLQLALHGADSISRLRLQSCRVTNISVISGVEGSPSGGGAAAHASVILLDVGGGVCSLRNMSSILVSDVVLDGGEVLSLSSNGAPPMVVAAYISTTATFDPPFPVDAFEIKVHRSHISLRNITALGGSSSTLAALLQVGPALRSTSGITRLFLIDSSVSVDSATSRGNSILVFGMWVPSVEASNAVVTARRVALRIGAAGSSVKPEFNAAIGMTVRTIGFSDYLRVDRIVMDSCSIVMGSISSSNSQDLLLISSPSFVALFLQQPMGVPWGTRSSFGSGVAVIHSTIEIASPVRATGTFHLKALVVQGGGSTWDFSPSGGGVLLSNVSITVPTANAFRAVTSTRIRLLDVGPTATLNSSAINMSSCSITTSFVCSDSTSAEGGGTANKIEASLAVLSSLPSGVAVSVTDSTVALSATAASASCNPAADFDASQLLEIHFLKMVNASSIDSNNLFRAVRLENNVFNVSLVSAPAAPSAFSCPPHGCSLLHLDNSAVQNLGGDIDFNFTNNVIVGDSEGSQPALLSLMGPTQFAAPAAGEAAARFAFSENRLAQGTLRFVGLGSGVAAPYSVGRSRFDFFCNAWPRSFENTLGASVESPPAEVFRHCPATATESHSATRSRTLSVVPPPTTTTSTTTTTNTTTTTTTTTTTIDTTNTTANETTSTTTTTTALPLNASILDDDIDLSMSADLTAPLGVFTSLATATGAGGSVVRGLSLLSIVGACDPNEPPESQKNKTRPVPFPQSLAPFITIGSPEFLAPHRGAVIANALLAPPVVVVFALSFFALLSCLKKKEGGGGGDQQQQQQSGGLRELAAEASAGGRVFQTLGFGIEGAWASGVMLAAHDAANGGDAFLGIFVGILVTLFTLATLYLLTHIKVFGSGGNDGEVLHVPAQLVQTRRDEKDKKTKITEPYQSSLWSFVLGKTAWRRPSPLLGEERFWWFRVLTPCWGKVRGPTPEKTTKNNSSNNKDSAGGGGVSAILALIASRSMFIDCLFTAVMGAMRGFSLTDPCSPKTQSALYVVVSINIAAFLQTLLLRPFASPLRQLLDFCSGLTMVIASIMAVTGERRGVKAVAVTSMVLGICSALVCRALSVAAAQCLKLRLQPEAADGTTAATTTQQVNAADDDAGMLAFLQEALFNDAPPAVQTAPAAVAPSSAYTPPADDETPDGDDDYDMIDLSELEIQEGGGGGGDELLLGEDEDIFGAIEDILSGNGDADAAAAADVDAFDVGGGDDEDDGEDDHDDDDGDAAPSGGGAAEEAASGGVVNANVVDADAAAYEAPDASEMRLKRLLDELDDETTVEVVEKNNNKNNDKKRRAVSMINSNDKTAEEIRRRLAQMMLE